jgi:type I restriction enzyme S subunit
VGVIPEDWEVKPLGEVLNRGRLGGNYPNQLRTTDCPLMKMGNLARGQFDVAKVEYIAPAIAPEEQHRLKKGDVLLNTRNTLDLVGKVAIWRCELPLAYYNSNLMRLEFNPGHVASNEYANAALNAHGAINFLRGLATGTTSVAAIYTRDLLQMPFITPPIPEQRAIAGALSDVDALLGALDRLIAKKRDLKQAAMQQLLTGKTRLPGFKGEWRKTTLGQVMTHCASGSTPPRNRPEFFKGTIPWITSGELNYNIIFDTSEKVTHAAVARANLSIIPKGTFLMAITGLEAEGTRGSCGIVGVPSTTNQSCMAIYPTSGLTSEFLFQYYVLRGNSLAFVYCQGTKQQSYTAKLVKLLPIELPPTTDEQTAIAEVLSDMDAEIAALERRREKTRALKQGMMQELLTGRTRLV